MSNFFTNDLSASFVMDLYRVKIKAEKRGDANALENLKQHYPDLFADEFQDFIDKAKLVALHLDQKYGQNFSTMFEAGDLDQVEKLH